MATSESEILRLKGKEKLSKNELRFLTIEEKLEKVEEQVREIAEAGHTNQEGIQSLEEDVHCAMAVLRAEVDDLRADFNAKFAVMEKAIANGGAIANQKCKLPEPKHYGGDRDPNIIDNFLWQVEEYFTGSRLTDEAARVSTAAMYLSDDAILWWRRRVNEKQRVSTWEEFKTELRKYFFPEDVDYQARKELRALKHKGTNRDYVKSFNSLMLSIPTMAEEDRLFSFLAGLRPWAEQELRRREVKTLSDVLATVEKLSEFERKYEGNP